MEDVGSKMVFLEASLAMLRDLGAKMANKSAKMIFTLCFSHLHYKSINLTMCFCHSSSQNAVFCEGKNRNCAFYYVFLTLRCTECERSLKMHPQDGREHPVQDACAEFWLGGVAR